MGITSALAKLLLFLDESEHCSIYQRLVSEIELTMQSAMIICLLIIEFGPDKLEKASLKY